MTVMPLFKNNATSRLLAAVAPADTQLRVRNGEGAKFPAPAAGEFFMVTIEDRRTNQVEICQCTARAADILTVVRAQEGSVAQSFLIDATVSNRFTAGTWDSITTAVYDKAAADAKFVDVAGDTMTGNLGIPLTPAANNHATSKQYVDQQIAAIGGIPEAPNNANTYGRGATAWVQVYNKTEADAQFVAQATYTASDVLAKLLTVDGSGSGLDADTLDGYSSGYFLPGATYTAADVLAKLVTVDGAGSGLDADLLDGQQSSYYLALANATGAISDAQHGNCGGGALHALATSAIAGFMVDVPNDGIAYARRNLAWTATSAFVDAPNDASAYVRSALNWVVGYTKAAIDTLLGAKIAGPAAATDNALARFDLATGKIIQNSNAILDDTGALTLAAGLSAATIAASGTIEAGTTFRSTGATAILATVGAGTVYLRPNGSASVVGQITLDSIGTFTTSGQITATGAVIASGTVESGGTFRSNSATAILATTGAGTVYMRPNGSGSASGQATLDSTGLFTVSGSVTATSVVQGTNGLKGPVVSSIVTSGARYSLADASGLNIYNDGSYTVNINNVAASYSLNLAPGIINVTGGLLYFQTAGTSRAYMSTTGNWNFTPAGAGYGLDVRALSSPVCPAIIGFCPNTSYYGISGQYSSGNYSFYGNGGAFLASGSWATSDARFKTVTGQVDGKVSLSAVMAIPVVTFAPSSPQAAIALNVEESTELFGFLAQDIEPLISGAVRDIEPPAHDLALRALLMDVPAPEKDTDAATALAAEPTTFKALNDHYMLATLWAAVQELTAQVQALQVAAAKGEA